MDNEKKIGILDYEAYSDFEDRLFEQQPEAFVPGKLLDYRLFPEQVLFDELSVCSDGQLKYIAGQLCNYPDDERPAPAHDLIEMILSIRVADKLIQKLKGKSQ